MKHLQLVHIIKITAFLSFATVALAETIGSHILTIKNGTKGAVDITVQLEGPDCKTITMRIDSGDRKEINIDTCCAISYKIKGITGPIAAFTKSGLLTSTGVETKAYGMQSCSDQTFTIIQTGGNNISPLALDTVNGIQ